MATAPDPKQICEDLGIEDVESFLKAVGDQAQDEVLNLDPTPWLPERMALRLTRDEWTLFQGAPKPGTPLESFLRAIVTFAITQEPIPRSEALQMVNEAIEASMLVKQPKWIRATEETPADRCGANCAEAVWILRVGEAGDYFPELGSWK